MANREKRKTPPPRLARLEDDVEHLVEAAQLLIESQTHMQRAIGRLATGQRQLRVDLRRLTDTVGEMRGDYLEHRYRAHAPAYFQSLLRRLREVPAARVDELASDAEEAGRISDADRQDILRADLVLQGQDRESKAPRYLVAEISAVIDSEDVRRAARRAGLWSLIIGAPALPVVAGEQITAPARHVAGEQGVAIALNGRTEASDQ